MFLVLSLFIVPLIAFSDVNVEEDSRRSLQSGEEEPCVGCFKPVQDENDESVVKVAEFVAKKASDAFECRLKVQELLNVESQVKLRIERKPLLVFLFLEITFYAVSFTKNV